MTREVFDSEEPLEAWESPELRSKREAWRGATQPSKPTPVDPTGFVEYYRTILVNYPAVLGPHSPQSPATGALWQAASTLSIAKTLSELASLRREVEALRAWKASRKSSQVEAIPEIDPDTRDTAIAVALHSARQAARETLSQYGPVIVREQGRRHDALADTILYVVAEEPSESAALLAAEKAFYRALRKGLPDDLLPVVDVILRFEPKSK